jgi:hypothetical protein
MDRAANLAAMDRRGKELRYLTEHYRELLGLIDTPFWALLMLVGAWSNALSGVRGLWLWLMWSAPIAVGVAMVKLPLWTRDWYERRYGVVWTADEGEDEGIEVISLLQGEDELVRERWRKRRKQRFWIAAVVAAAFYLPGFWLHGIGSFEQASWVGLCFLFVWPPVFYLGPTLFEPVNACGLAMWRWVVYAMAVLVLLVGDLLFLAGKVRGTWTLVFVGGVMLLVSLHDHWLFTRLLGGGARARGGCDE